MLIECPECAKQVSDRAAACPSCGFPIAEHVRAGAEEAARKEERSTRKVAGEVDCVPCEARGFRMLQEDDDRGGSREVFRWCALCEHSGRVPLCESSAGYFAVAYRSVDAFLAGQVDADSDDVHHVGTERPEGHRYPKAGPRKAPSEE